MKAEVDLLNAFCEWRRLAEAEGESITTRNWKFVAACQAELAALQPQITRLLQTVRQNWSRFNSDKRRENEARLQAAFHDLICLEKHNETLLARLRYEAGERTRQLELSGRNLQKIQRSYAGPPPAAWCSIS